MKKKKKELGLEVYGGSGPRRFYWYQVSMERSGVDLEETHHTQREWTRTHDWIGVIGLAYPRAYHESEAVALGRGTPMLAGSSRMTWVL